MSPDSPRLRFERAMAWLASFTDWEQKLHRVPSRSTFDLGRMHRLLGRMGNPHHGLNVAHITGTKGKTSITWMTDAILVAHGLRTLRFLSPHVQTVHERLALSGQQIDDARFADLAEALRATLDAGASPAGEDLPSFFECITLMAFGLARDAEVDALVLEVGLGGTLDATNVVDPTVAVIASVGLEHQRLLGDTIEEVAANKAGILKRARPGLHGLAAGDPARPVLEARGRAIEAPLRGPEDLDRLSTLEPCSNPSEGPRLRASLAAPEGQIGPFELRAGAPHQATNAQLAVAAARAVLARAGKTLDPATCRRALDGLGIPGRAEWRPGSPPTLLDGAHTVESVDALGAVASAVSKSGRIHLVTAVLRGREPAALLAPLQPLVDRIVATGVDSPRSLSATELGAALADLQRPLQIEPDPRRALDLARAAADADDLVLVTGSLYLVGALLGRHAEQ